MSKILLTILAFTSFLIAANGKTEVLRVTANDAVLNPYNEKYVAIFSLDKDSKSFFCKKQKEVQLYVSGQNQSNEKTLYSSEDVNWKWCTYNLKTLRAGWDRRYWVVPENQNWELPGDEEEYPVGEIIPLTLNFNKVSDELLPNNTIVVPKEATEFEASVVVESTKDFPISIIIHE